MKKKRLIIAIIIVVISLIVILFIPKAKKNIEEKKQEKEDIGVLEDIPDVTIEELQENEKNMKEEEKKLNTDCIIIQ